MMQDMLKRAEASRERARTLESVPGSGYHDNDKNPVNGAPMAPQRNGKCKASENPVAFFDERDVHFIGEDAVLVASIIVRYAERLKNQPLESLNGSQRQTVQRVAAGRLKTETIEGTPRLSLWLSEWNDWLYALDECGVGVTGLPAKSP